MNVFAYAGIHGVLAWKKNVGRGGEERVDLDVNYRSLHVQTLRKDRGNREEEWKRGVLRSDGKRDEVRDKEAKETPTT